MFKKTSGRVGLTAAATMIVAAGVFTASCASAMGRSSKLVWGQALTTTFSRL